MNATDATTTLDIVTLVVAICGVFLAGLALTWQAATFVLSGSRVRVELRRGMVRRASGRLILSVMPLTATERDRTILHSQGFGGDYLVAVVRSRGRLAATVVSVTMKLEGGFAVEMLGDPDTPELPYRLEHENKQSWHLDLEPVQRFVNDLGAARDVWMLVELGTGKVVETRRRFPRRGGVLKVSPQGKGSSG